MATDQDKYLAHQLEQSLRRLAAQKGSSLSLRVTTIVKASSRARAPVDREPVSETMVVEVDHLNHLFAEKTPSKGFCVRMIFDGKLYAAIGEDAEKIKTWAQKTAQQKTTDEVTPFPDVGFEHVVDKVKVREGGELTVA